jgi:hypothetical protein
MDKNKEIIESIRARRIKQNSGIYFDTHQRIRELRKEIVKVSFQNEPNQELHQFLIKQLKQANDELIKYAS